MKEQDENAYSSYDTPYDDKADYCDRTCAKLRIYTGEMKPSVVTELLGIQPTDFVQKGVSAEGIKAIGKLNGWFLSSETFVNSKDLRRHLDWLIEILEKCVEGLRQLQMKEGVHMSINCIWWSRYRNGGPTLWPKQMRGLAELNLECSFDCAFYGADDEEIPG